MSPEVVSSTADPAPAMVSRRSLVIAGFTIAAVAAIVVIMGVTTRHMADAKLSEWTENQAVPTVAVNKPDTNGKKSGFSLPGRLEGFSQAQIYARVSGYLKDWKVDIGAAVKAGDLLGEIDAPDLDQQIMQAEAELAASQANSNLAQMTLQRGQQLVPSGAVSKQDLDQRQADASNKMGMSKSAQANLDRLRVLEKYKRITAPFDGLVTARNTDLGALINAGASSGPPLFVVSDTSKLRAYVNVPQNFVPNIRLGTKAHIAVPEYPGRQFSGTVEASAQAVDAASGTTRMLIVIDNATGELMSGAFTTVSFDLPHADVSINVPASALIFDRSGLHIATVDKDNRVVLKAVTIARDLGREVEIASGLTADDRVIESPPDGVATGDKVRVANEAGTPAQPETAAK
ncbi:MAG TPA: efflux RND transporter periplasmic adaptor subunit [Xanthobacteraceae bacterium]|jgi:RND family efflux transporter MFP subunit|nr:efflux RND transporter periplasmic adaptor subunit [Xanthobacteraceae bacterium]